MHILHIAQPYSGVFYKAYCPFWSVTPLLSLGDEQTGRGCCAFPEGCRVTNADANWGSAFSGWNGHMQNSHTWVYLVVIVASYKILPSGSTNPKVMQYRWLKSNNFLNTVHTKQVYGCAVYLCFLFGINKKKIWGAQFWSMSFLQWFFSLWFVCRWLWWCSVSVHWNAVDVPRERVTVTRHHHSCRSEPTLIFLYMCCVCVDQVQWD